MKNLRIPSTALTLMLALSGASASAAELANLGGVPAGSTPATEAAVKAALDISGDPYNFQMMSGVQPQQDPKKTAAETAAAPKPAVAVPAIAAVDLDADAKDRGFAAGGLLAAVSAGGEAPARASRTDAVKSFASNSASADVSNEGATTLPSNNFDSNPPTYIVVRDAKRKILATVAAIAPALK